jgi:hypothetical protein
MVGASGGGFFLSYLRNKACLLLFELMVALLLLLLADHGGEGEEKSTLAWARSGVGQGCYAFLVLYRGTGSSLRAA